MSHTASVELRQACRACRLGEGAASLEAGLLNVHKPPGPTSHDLVERVRRLWGQRKVGHGGTLDPMASGVLILGLGRGTRVLEYVQEQPKTYRASIRFGIETDTLDAEGEALRRSPVPGLEHHDLEALLQPFVGRILQVPPRYSALKRSGQPLYARARRGEAVEPEAREVEIYELHLEDWEPPLARLVVVCGRGTYIRSLARDLGQALGCGAHLAGLVRTRVARFVLEDALPPEALEGADPATVLHPLDEAVLHWPALELGAEEDRRLRHGRPLPDAQASPGTRARVYGPGGTLRGLVEAGQGHWRPLKILSPA